MRSAPRPARPARWRLVACACALDRDGAGRGSSRSPVAAGGFVPRECDHAGHGWTPRSLTASAGQGSPVTASASGIGSLTRVGNPYVIDTSEIVAAQSTAHTRRGCLMRTQRLQSASDGAPETAPWGPAPGGGNAELDTRDGQ